MHRRIIILPKWDAGSIANEMNSAQQGAANSKSSIYRSLSEDQDGGIVIAARWKKKPNRLGKLGGIHSQGY
jgi:hypothetical protein